MEKYIYYPQGVCSNKMEFMIENNKLVDMNVIGGCNGNLKGIKALIIGMDINEIIDKLSGITCNMKKTSCPDQIAKGLKECVLDDDNSR